MPLKSQLFRGDAKLEAAAVSDPAHIMSGAIGTHVIKIQTALNRLDGAGLSVDGIYGPRTTAAVLAYKQKRGIINRAIQTTADGIVGKMTMASLDQEMLEAEAEPLSIVPIFPLARRIPARRGGVLLNFAITGAQPVGNLIPVPKPPGPPQEVIIERGDFGTLSVLLASGGKMFRTQKTNPFQVARMNNVELKEKETADLEVLEIRGDSTIVTYESRNCGETFFQARVGSSPERVSEIVHLLSLVRVPSKRNKPARDYSPDANFPSGLMSKQGTPLNPLPGRKISVFGEGEALPDFEDYSTDINFCSHTYSLGATAGIGHRPWTDDPRKPTASQPVTEQPGIRNKSIMNIHSRGSPLKQPAIDEILRIGANGCRVTYGGPDQNVVDALIDAFSGSSTIIENKKLESGGPAIIFELF